MGPPPGSSFNSLPAPLKKRNGRPEVEANSARIAAQTVRWQYHAAPSKIDSSKVAMTFAASVTGLNFAYVVPPEPSVYVFVPVPVKMPWKGPGVDDCPPLNPCWW